MNTFSVSRLALALAFGVTLTACSSTPPDQRPSDQTAPGTSSRPILSAKEAQNFDAQHYFASLTPGAAAWNPSPITLPAQPDFVVGPAGTQGVTHTTIQAAVDAAIIKRTNKRQYIAVMPGEYQGTDIFITDKCRNTPHFCVARKKEIIAVLTKIRMLFN